MKSVYDNKIITANIRNARLYRNYSQDYLAAKLGISQNGYSKIEVGYSNLSLRNFLLIVDVLDFELADLLVNSEIKKL